MRLLVPGMKPRLFPVIQAKPELYEFEVRKKRFIFDPNTLRLGLLDEGEKAENHREFAKPVRPIFAPAHFNVPGAILFNVTEACNMRCSYCFVAHDAERSKACKHLSTDTALKALGQLMPWRTRQDPKRRVQFCFFGGEPLMRPDFIRTMVNHIRNFVCLNPSFHITTNGTLVTEEIATFLETNAFSAIVSLDGSAKGHNLYRKFPDGQGSYDAVLAGLRTLQQFAPKVLKRTTLRSTFTRESLQVESLRDRLSVLNNLAFGKGFGCHVSVEPVFLGEAACTDPSYAAKATPNYTSEEEIAFWDDQYRGAAEWWLECFRRRTTPVFHHFNIYLSRLLQGRPNCSECGAGRGYFSIAPDGSIYACHRESNTGIGNVHRGGIDHQLAAPWQDNRYYARLKCPTCWMRNVCGGGCREISMSAGLGTSMPLPVECAWKSMFIRHCAWILSEIPDTAEDQDFLRSFIRQRQP